MELMNKVGFQGVRPREVVSAFGRLFWLRRWRNCIGLLVVLLVGAAVAFAQPALPVASTPSGAPIQSQAAPRAVAQDIVAEPDITLFAVMAALNAAGYDAAMDRQIGRAHV